MEKGGIKKPQQNDSFNTNTIKNLLKEIKTVYNKKNNSPKDKGKEKLTKQGLVYEN